MELDSAAGAVERGARHIEGSAATSAEGLARRAMERGDREEALEHLMRTYGEALYRYCRQMVADPDLADEAHQMTFVQAFEGLSRFAGRSSFRVWLYAIARHRCLDALKMARRRGRRFPSAADLGDAPTVTASPEDRAITAGLRRALQACLATLSTEIREAVLLRYQEGFSYPQMSELMGLPAPTLQARVARALPRLRRCLEERGASL